MSDLRELYQEVILHHAKSPRNFGVVEDADHVADGHNPLCGDRLHLTLKIGADGLVEEVRFDGQGCAISTASASLMTEAVRGKTVAEARHLLEGFHALVTGEGDAAAIEDLPPKLAVFAGVREFPVRVKCAMLAWRTLEAALQEGAGEPASVTTE